MDQIRRYVTGFALAGPAFVALGHLGYAVYYHEAYFYDTVWILRYYAGPLLVAVIYLVVLLSISRRSRLAVAINAYAVLAAILAYELYPYLVDAGSPRSERARTILRLRDSGHDAYPHFPVLPVNELIGADRREEAVVSNIPLVTTVLCRHDDGRWISYEADRGGFNNPAPRGDERLDAGELDLAVVGDSFIQGICLPREETIVGQLRRWEAQTLGFGIADHGPLLELETLKRHVRPLEPREVVWCYYEGNDLADLARESKIAWLVNSIDDLPKVSYPDPERVEVVKKALDDLMADRLSSGDDARPVNWTAVLAFRSFFETLGLHYGRAPDFLDLFARVLAAAKSTVEAWGGTLHFCYLPEYTRYAGLVPPKVPFDTFKRSILDIADELGIDTIDVAAAFDRHPAPLELFDSHKIHYTSEGAALAAEAIADALAGDGNNSYGPVARRQGDRDARAAIAN